MSDELFRQDPKNSGERAIIQGDDNAKPKEKHQGPMVGVDSFRDRFERVEPGKRELGEYSSNRTPMHRVPDYSSADKLKAEIAEVMALGSITWDLPVWRPAELSREVLKRLSVTVDQLKVVMRASDSLSDQVKALYEVEKPVTASDADETTEETKDE
jgi:hypothetical protein